MVIFNGAVEPYVFSKGYKIQELHLSASEFNSFTRKNTGWKEIYYQGIIYHVWFDL